VNDLVQALLQNNFAVQLAHDAKETTWENHGFVKVKDADGQLLAESAKFQHNRFLRSPERADDLKNLSLQGEVGAKLHKEQQQVHKKSSDEQVQKENSSNEKVQQEKSSGTPCEGALVGNRINLLRPLKLLWRRVSNLCGSSRRRSVTDKLLKSSST